MAINYLGGKCVKCGFKGHMASLHIHHTDTALKSQGRNRATVFATSGTSRASLTDDEKKELDTCELLCANCHAVESAGSTNPYLKFINATAASLGTWYDTWEPGMACQEVRPEEVRPAVEAQERPDAV